MIVSRYLSAAILIASVITGSHLAWGEEGTSSSPGERGGILAHTRTEQDLKKRKKIAAQKAAAQKAAQAKKNQKSTTGQSSTTGSPAYDVRDAKQAQQVVVAPAPEPKVRPWTVDLYYEDYYTMSDADHNTGLMFTDGYAGGTYRLDKNWRLYIRQNYIMNVDRNREPENKQEFEYNGKLSDTEFGFYRDNIFTWENGGSFNAYTRFYVSTGYHQWAVDANEYSGQLFRFRPQFITSQPIGKSFELGHIIDPRVMVNQRDGQIIDDGTGKLIGKANATHKIEQFFYFTSHFGHFSQTCILGTYDFWYHKFVGPDGKTLPTHKSFMYTDLSLTWQIVKEVAVTIGVENDMETDRVHPYEDSWLRERETYYYLNTFVRI